MARPGHIYVMDCGDSVLKVGFSTKPEERSVALGRLDVLYVSDWFDNADRIELTAHKLLKLANVHVYGERFNASLDEAIKAINEAEKLVSDGGDVKLPDAKECFIRLGMPESLRIRIETWRAKQFEVSGKVPSFSEAVRQLVERALDTQTRR